MTSSECGSPKAKSSSCREKSKGIAVVLLLTRLRAHAQVLNSHRGPCGMAFAILICGSGVTVFTATAYAQSHESLEAELRYVDALHSSLAPTRQECANLRAKFEQASAAVNRAHSKCLDNAPADNRPGGTCTKAACQGLHNLLAYVPEREAAESRICDERVALREADEKRTAALSARISPQNQSREEPSGLTSTANTYSNYAVGISQAQKAIGQAIKVDRRLSGPLRNSVGDRAINSANKRLKVVGTIYTATTAIDTAQKAHDGDWGGVANNATQTVIDTTMSRICQAQGPAAAACEAVYSGSHMLGDHVNNTFKERTGKTLQDHITDNVWIPVWEYTKKIVHGERSATTEAVQKCPNARQAVTSPSTPSQSRSATAPQADCH